MDFRVAIPFPATLYTACDQTPGSMNLGRIDVIGQRKEVTVWVVSRQSPMKFHQAPIDVPCELM